MIYCKGYCINQGYPNACGGVGIYFGPSKKVNLSERLPGTLQNISRAEIYAVMLAIRHSSKAKNVIIRTDNTYVIDSMCNWVKERKKSTGKSRTEQVAANYDLLRSLDELIKFHPIGVKFELVRSRSDEVPMYAAYRLADYATLP